MNMTEEQYEKLQKIIEACTKCEIALESMLVIANQVEKGFAEYGKTLTDAVDSNEFNADKCINAAIEECADNMQYLNGYKRHISNKNIARYDDKNTNFTH